MKNVISKSQKLAVAKKGIFEVTVVRNEIALCRIVNGVNWMMSKWYPIAYAPQMILKHANLADVIDAI
jgi:hypothetical protein